MFAQQPWLPNQDEPLERLWKEGRSASQIARELGSLGLRKCTRNAVIGRIHRLGLAKRITPSYGGPACTKEVRTARARRRTQKPPEQRAAPAIDSDPVAPLDPTLSVLKLSAFTCRYPIGDPLRPGFAFCGRTCSEEDPYCKHHAAIAYRPMEKRQQRGMASLAQWLDRRGRTQSMGVGL